MKKISLFFVFLLFSIQASLAQKVGLVFSGGGAKGAAHVGVIKALEENDIPIDYITGTSAGAIIGSLYAMGYTPEEMLELMMSEEFGYWQTGTVEDKYQYYFKSQAPTPSFGHFSIDFTDSLQIKTNILPQSLINPIQMNQAFMALYTPASAKAGWNFDNLFVPFRCVASDVYNKKPIIFKNGDLGDAVRASMTFPLFFKPIWKDSVPIFDGGIYDNFPVQPMKDAFEPDFIIGSTVSSGNNKPSSNIYNQVETMIMQKQDYNVDEEDGIMISFKFPDVSLLDFNRAKELMTIGYNKTLNLIDSIKSRVDRRVPLEEVNRRREEYKAGLPKLVFQNIYITGVPESQQKYIESQLHRDINKDFSFEEFKRVYFKTLSSSKIKEIIPHATYNRKTKKFDLYLDIKIKDEVKIDFGGNISSHQANQLYLGLNYQYLRRYAVDTKINLQVGNAFNGVNMSGRIYLNTSIPSFLQLEGTYSTKRYSESQSLFYEDVLPAFIKQKELYMKAKLGVPFLNKAKAEIGLAYGKLSDDYYQSTKIMSYNSDYDKSSYNLLATSLNVEENTLDYKQYPTNGTEKYLTAQFVVGKEQYTPSPAIGEDSKTDKNINWLQIKGHWQKYHNLSNVFNLGYMSELVISSKNLMQNYTASVLQAPAFTPTPHSKIVFNEAFRANQYVAAGITPIFKITKMLHFRLELYGFAPLYEINKTEVEEPYYKGIPYYGAFLNSFEYMGEAALVFQLPFASISLYGNGYSYPSKNFNFGVNIGFLIFNPRMID